MRPARRCGVREEPADGVCFEVVCGLCELRAVSEVSTDCCDQLIESLQTGNEEDEQSDDPEPEHGLVRGGGVVREPPLAEGLSDHGEVVSIRTELDPCVLPAVLARLTFECGKSGERKRAYFCARSPEPSRCQCLDHSATHRP